MVEQRLSVHPPYTVIDDVHVHTITLFFVQRARQTAERGQRLESMPHGDSFC